jgi:hypothetical protein
MDQTLMRRRTVLTAAAVATLAASTVRGAELSEPKPNITADGINSMSTPGALGDIPDNKTSMVADHRPSGKASGLLVRPAKGLGPQILLEPHQNP